MIAILMIALFAVQPLAKQKPLYKNEKIIKVNGYPALSYFEKGQTNKPLVIFIPGDAHLARISYSLEGAKKENFLANWVVKKGYSFLGASYPTDNAVYKGSVFPEFSIQDWGKQVVGLAKMVFSEHPDLSKHIVVIGWSMGGSIAEPLATAAKAEGIVVDCFIALDAVPGNPYIMQSGAFSPGKQLANGLADRSPLFNWCINAIKEQSIRNGEEIVSSEVYKQECLGNIPVNIEASEYRYDVNTGKFIKNRGLAISDSGVFGREANFPWIAMITSTDPKNSQISLTDQSEWNRITAFRLHDKFPPTELSPEKYIEYRNLCAILPQKVSRTVEGDHFFFLGKKGASKTADLIEELLSIIREQEQAFKEL